MPGNQTQRFDAVMEFTEQSVNDVISTFFDSGGLLSSFLNAVGLGSAEGAFSLDMLFDRPSDVPLPAGASNVIDLRFDIGADGSLGQLRAVAGLNMNRTTSNDFDIAEVDFRNQLHFTGFTAGSISIPLLPNLFANFLRNQVGAIPLFPVPVKRAATDPADLPTRGDIRIIDNTSATDRDALAIMLTFAGGSVGNASGLQNFINPGDTGAIAIFFRWLARILRPRVAGALQTSEANFVIGDDFLRLNRTIPVSGGGETADLTKLELRLRNGFIELKGEIAKSGFCYEATGKIAGRIRAEVVGGELVFKAEIDDPDVDIDIPWYCWLGAAVIGAIAGGLVGVLVGAVVGAVGGAVVGGVVGGVVVGGIVGAILIGILVPLLLAIAENVIETTVEGIAGNLADKLRQDLQVPAIGLNLIFQRVFIDDVAINFDARPIEKVPIRASGVLEVRNGQLIDLDNGQVGSEGMGSADLEWHGRGFGRQLRTRCGARLARTGLQDFAGILRWKLYPFHYADATVPLHELAVPLPFPDLPFLPESQKYLETRLVYALKTAEGRYSVVQVSEVFDDRIRLRYKTYEKPLPSVQLSGEFACDGWQLPEVVADLENIRFEATPRANLRFQPAKSAQPAQARLGRWRRTVVRQTSRTGHFRATVENFAGTLRYHWHVAGTDLLKKQGTVDIGSQKATYQTDQGHLILTLQSQKLPRALEFLVRVSVNDEAGNAISASKCVKFTPFCKSEVGVIPVFDLQVDTFHQHFSVVRLPLANLEPNVEPPHQQPSRTSSRKGK
ncbi:MAG: hypothetical protein N2318_03650 [Meiothermus sp.]|nr:hypothetical protein [Meiothermus sp.]